MPITTLKDATAVLDEMANALAARAHSPSHRQSRSGELKLAAPFSVFGLRIGDFDHPNFLARASHSGWIALAADEASTIAVRARDDGRPTFASLQFGWMPQRLLEAVQLAEAKLGSDLGNFEIRLLEIPSLRLIFLWLYKDQKRDFFVALGEGSDQGREQPQLVREIDKFIAAAKERKAHRAAVRLQSDSHDREEEEKATPGTIAKAAIAIIVLLAVVFYTVLGS